MVRVLWVLLFLWVFSGCAYQHPSLQVSHEKPTPPVIIKPEAPVEPEPEIPAQKSETSVEQKKTCFKYTHFITVKDRFLCPQGALAGRNALPHCKMVYRYREKLESHCQSQS